MSLLIAQNLSFAHRAEPLFEDLSFTIEAGDRIGLVGRNACGKSSLLRLLSGELEADSGVLTRQKGLIIERVAQLLPETLAEVSVFDAVACNARDPSQIHRVERILDELRFEQGDWDKPLHFLSGGWLNRALLARSLAAEPDLLLLDEPTNHLDLPGILFFEEFLERKVRAAIVLVSHDRSVLDACTNQTIFVRDGRAYGFTGSYSQARARLLQQDEAAMVARRAEEQELARLRRSANRLIRWARDAKSEKLRTRARNIEQRIERMEQDKTFVTTESPRAISVETAGFRAPIAVCCENLDVLHPDGGVLFSVESLFIKRGDRVAVLGKNGTGKTVFLKLLVAAYEAQRAAGEPIAGIRINPQLELGYYDQNLDRIPLHASLQAIVRDAMNVPSTTATRALVRAGFRVRDHGKYARELSGGDRARLQFLLLSLQQPSLLVLDEPTNHIDVDGCENLEAEVIDREATAIFVSHDRRFVANVATRFLVIDGRRLEEVQSPDDYYASERVTVERPAGSSSRPASTSGATLTADELLTQISDLERKAEAQRRQHPRRRNSARQVELETEIARLYQALDHVLAVREPKRRESG